MSKAAIKRILDEMKDPYEGIMYENGKPRKGLWARFRIEDVPFIATALASPAVAPVANDSAIDGWCPIVQRPTDHSEGWFKLADGSTFWGRWNRDHWERRTDALTMTAPIEARGGVEREGVEYPLNVFEHLPNDVYPVAFRSDPVAPVAVSVKGLEWEEKGGYWRAKGAAGWYIICQMGGDWVPQWGNYQAQPLESAKAAAQSDFNARILSSIIPATKGGYPDAEAVTLALNSLEQLANMPLCISLEQWSNLCSPILCVLQALQAAAQSDSNARILSSIVNLGATR